ncbi:MAG: hypothetical protein HOA04_05115 [Euryarchaeota archaeon]|jgi:hypothetical protein|nr:hypothetical protein [Euryarchaeota archaeon]
MSQKFLGGVLLIIGAVLIGAIISKTISSDETAAIDADHDGQYSGLDYDLAHKCLDDHSQVGAHFHPYLTIKIDGDEVLIPENTGISTDDCDGMHFVHTHDDSGKLHVETPEPEEVKLGVFFQIWDVYFAEDGISTYRVNDTHEMVMSVDGVVVDSYGEHVLSDEQQILIEYVKKS